MKKLLALLSVLGLTSIGSSSLVACGKDGESQPTPTSLEDVPLEIEVTEAAVRDPLDLTKYDFASILSTIDLDEDTWNYVSADSSPFLIWTYLKEEVEWILGQDESLKPVNDPAYGTQLSVELADIDFKEGNDSSVNVIIHDRVHWENSVSIKAKILNVKKYALAPIEDIRKAWAAGIDASTLVHGSVSTISDVAQILKQWIVEHYSNPSLGVQFNETSGYSLELNPSDSGLTSQGVILLRDAINGQISQIPFVLTNVQDPVYEKLDPV